MCKIYINDKIRTKVSDVVIDLNFKNIKEKARKVFKNHYVILVLACALAALAGSEFAGSLSINETTDMFNQIKYVMPGVHDKVENIKKFQGFFKVYLIL